jgi:hypothetical protein
MNAVSQEVCSQWCERVHQAQTARMSPEERIARARRVEVARNYEQNMRKCNAARCHAERGVALANEGLRQMTTCRAPADYMAAQTRWSSAQMASEERQQTSIGMLVNFSGTSRLLQSVATERAEALAEVCALSGTRDVRTVAADAEQASGDCLSDSVEVLLRQLRTEPAADEECSAKFILYEGYAAQVEKMRGSLFGFYEESVPSVPAAVAAEMAKQIKAIDSDHAMGIPDGVREWFVYHMMRQASKNNVAMAGVLHGFEKKLELLANMTESDCPVCLEPFTEDGPHVAETLGCCHKVCHECWVNWSEVQHGSPFCPLCRQDAFMDALAERVTQR